MKNDGLTMETAIVMAEVGSTSAGSQEIYRIVEQMYGGNDGDYFIHGETTAENKKLKKKYRIVFVEDGNGTKRQVYFDITNWS